MQSRKSDFDLEKGTLEVTQEIGEKSNEVALDPSEYA